MLDGEQDILASRFAKREGVDLILYRKDIYRHLSLYSVLNKGSKCDFFYDTTDNFLSAEKIKKIIEKREKISEKRN